MRLSHATRCLESSLLLSPTDLPQQQHHHQGALVRPSILTPIRRGGPSCTTVPFSAVVCFFVFPLPLRRSQALPETLGDGLGCFWGTLKLVRLLLGSRGTKTDQKETKRQPEPSRGKRASARLLPSQGPLRRFPSVGSPAVQQRDHRDSGCCGLSFPSHHQTSKRQTITSLTWPTRFVGIRGSTIARADHNLHKLLLVCATLRILLPIAISLTYLILTFASHWSPSVHHHTPPPNRVLNRRRRRCHRRPAPPPPLLSQSWFTPLPQTHHPTTICRARVTAPSPRRRVINREKRNTPLLVHFTGAPPSLSSHAQAAHTDSHGPSRAVLLPSLPNHHRA